MAKQFSKKVEVATAPFQYALSTKAGCECVAHILQALTDRDPEATIMSIDGIGAFDLISRISMLEGLLRMEDGVQLLPFVRCFYGSPSTYLWEDEMGITQHISQGEGGEQGGHGRLWPNRLWLNRLWPAFFVAEFGQTDFGQS